ncbi:uncharacterized protein F5Z01DRAFT_171005 [Emericellopsis atlantica]|uniref:Uncharacterized protein n=1 Tax=Emericellopsis atlantica TaxID=2614577 RepID=A0A9P8CPR4_9HYPO|nr:uncharacterized protein F5Z01DRAFT_171005 [Emericellopsis atlantica]KAG9253021.1 hypothetical protein F5Z01DRAFT_171005 [Emericellopsis atlantica]
MAHSKGLKSSIWAAAPSHAAYASYQIRTPTQDHSSRSNRARDNLPSSYSANSTNFSTTGAASSSTVSGTPSSNSTAFTTPSTSNGSPAAAALSPARTLHRLEQACLRLRWKSHDLEAAWTRCRHPQEFGFPPNIAEENFKIDFYEFYTWIENALVLIQRIFGIEINARSSAVNARNHAYHHNVLLALSDKQSPLHELLGKGEVNIALWKAKELRNRWKDAAEGNESTPLGMYDLTWILGRVLSGLEAGYEKAREVASSSEPAASGTEDWAWMVDDSMDWEGC